MFVSIMETARNSTFRNPFVTTVNCDADTTSNGTKTLVANRNIAAAAATAEGGIKLMKMLQMNLIGWFC